ncbi:16S rRNA m(7)G-527 methyltransferase [Ferrimonas balearica DSM 9799]|uniref:Ribosomal RNA small subunit methyltransferase G n=1 Tax=Ferrimonas balearica (strain DSM 9799 / CCM 4581 / KCTC 23876 / PAT) TaxID=550540 RepID=E1SR59_FERBD|nr:16S rRNA (guanine(527)-N(7))-methyltransferase RsmG [Ferrimonas balearica]ADN77989.1 16S rRNA m(7)G-527 methyltransferase [Ferrimonas balearica DSM 9799]MBW3166680.1 16S rRNA (guanine(527)-N(7))-methyltransferase RsmG [Ferrimonas balearica]MBY5982444.1 16S rRNA (guanine(527)-N(7))-methyltransferase RsmG [Ferrimonas balearica]
MLAKRLSTLINDSGLTVSAEQQAQLVELVRMLDKWNKAYNLTSVRDPMDMLEKHILDSIVVGPHLQGRRFIDVGTGPGLPGLPLAICNPDKEFVLLDSLGKRIRFIRQVIHSLGLTNVTAVESRVEAYQPDPGFDVVLSRAFASLEDMLTWCAHLPTAEGHFLALKGQLDAEELAAIPAGFEVMNTVALKVPGLDAQRHLVQVKKVD